MILPTKHISFSESLLGLGAVLMTLIDGNVKVEELWERFQSVNQTDVLPAYHNFESFISALDFLFLAGAISYSTDGGLTREAD